MPAKNLRRVADEGTYSHIFNKGVEGRLIFNDDQDYEVFLNYLKDYLTSPAHPESTKKTFTVKGRTFQGTPHQPKNYFNKVELIAYSLTPDRFHLLLLQKSRGSVERFIRSLCTRYSMYFNKKYARRGTLFEGPYKSVLIKDKLQLALLSRYFHQGTNYSSYLEYLGQRETSWVKPDAVLSFKGVGNYKQFIEKYKPDQKESDLLEKITLDHKIQELERRNPSGANPLLTIPRFLIVSVIFFLLFGTGLRNINVSATKNIAVVPTSVPAVLSESVEPTPSPNTKTMLMVKNVPENAIINIRMEPIINAPKVGEAKNGDLFEYVSINSGWFGVKLTDGSTGFIHSDFIEIIEINNNE